MIKMRPGLAALLLLIACGPAKSQTYPLTIDNWWIDQSRFRCIMNHAGKRDEAEVYLAVEAEQRGPDKFELPKGEWPSPYIQVRNPDGSVTEPAEWFDLDGRRVSRAAVAGAGGLEMLAAASRISFVQQGYRFIGSQERRYQLVEQEGRLREEARQRGQPLPRVAPDMRDYAMRTEVQPIRAPTRAALAAFRTCNGPRQPNQPASLVYAPPVARSTASRPSATAGLAAAFGIPVRKPPVDPQCQPGAFAGAVPPRQFTVRITARAGIAEVTPAAEEAGLPGTKEVAARLRANLRASPATDAQGWYQPATIRFTSAEMVFACPTPP